jgi:iron complex transport system permease protein
MFLPRNRTMAEIEGHGSAGSDPTERYFRHTSRKAMFLVACGAVLFVIMLFSITVGTFSIPLEDVVRALFGQQGTYYNIVWNIRLPRIMAGIVAGASLAVAGTVMQCVLRNPLASPYTLSLSQSSVVVNNPYTVTLMAFIWAIVGTTLIMLLSAMTRVSPEAMILAGVAIAAIFQAGITALQFFADSVQLSTMVYWTFGDLGRVTWEHLMILAAVLAPILMYFIYSRWSYNAMDAGEETANGLGVNTKRMRMVGMVLSSMLAAVVVSFMGIIGFIGLVAPHMTRRIIGGDHRFLIPGSALVGAILLMGSDTIARTVISPLVIPVGVITAFLGGPLFIYLLIKGYKK